MSFRCIKSALLPVIALCVVACSSTDLATAVNGADVTRAAPASPTAAVQPGRGFVWSEDKGFQVIQLPSYATSMDVTGMNNRGQVVGYVTLGAGTENYRAFIWSAEKGFKAIGSLVGPEGISMALAIDDAGQVTGVSEGPSTIYNTGMDIQLPDAFTWNESAGMKATAITSSISGKKLPANSNCLDVRRVGSDGQAIGYAGHLENDGGCGATSAVLWDQAGNPAEIDSCGVRPWCRTTVVDLNNSGEVVGYREGIGFRWTASGGFVDVPLADAAVNVINESGTAAGMAGAGEAGTPFVWAKSGAIRTLQLPAGAKYGYPVSINEKEQIAGNFK